MSIEKLILAVVGLCCFAYILTYIVRQINNGSVCTRCGDMHKDTKHTDTGGGKG